MPSTAHTRTALCSPPERVLHQNKLVVGGPERELLAAKTRESLHCPWTNLSLGRTPAKVIPIFSRTLADATFAGLQVASIRSSPSVS